MRRNGTGAEPAANMEGKNDAEDGQVQDIVILPTNGPTGKREDYELCRRPCDTRYGRLAPRFLVPYRTLFVARTHLQSVEGTYVAGIVA